MRLSKKVGVLYKDTIPKTAQQIIEEISFYSQYIDVENFKWTFTSEIPREEPYITALNDILTAI